jgi:EpsD family peptidyl-prolyl cis-trans isomerase
MKNLSRLPAALMLCGVVALSACGKSTKAPNADGSNAGSQVIARVNGEEVTVHQLNAELANIPQAGQDQKDIQKEVLRAIVFRTMLRQEAVKAGLDKNQQLQLLIDGAKDKILADAYISSQTGSTPPPTSTEVNEYIASNPLQFGERRIYQFQRLTMPVDKYSNELVPMFDQKETFDDFQNYLNGKTIPYTLAEVRLPSTDFPKQVQDELVKFGVGDNVVVRGQQSIVILKIKSWVDMPVEQTDAERIAQNALHQQSQQERARALRDQMAHSGKVEFLGEFAGLSLDMPKPAQPAAPPADGSTPKPDTQTTPAPGTAPAPAQTGAPADVNP